MVLWINGPYGVGKSTLAEKLHELEPRGHVFDAEAVGNAVRDNLPEGLYNGPIFEGYPMWFRLCAELLLDIAGRYNGDLYVPMTLVYPDSFGKIERPLRERGISTRHILLESSHEVVRGRILARGEPEDCWCMEHIGLCLDHQREFQDVIRIKSYGTSVDELAAEVLKRVKKSGEKRA